jgi:hypothetical protein
MVIMSLNCKGLRARNGKSKKGKAHASTLARRSMLANASTDGVLLPLQQDLMDNLSGGNVNILMLGIHPDLNALLIQPIPSLRWLRSPPPPTSKPPGCLDILSHKNQKKTIVTVIGSPPAPTPLDLNTQK